MNDDKKQDFKKSFPNGFVWFLMAAFLLALMVQNFVDIKFAKVAFSYQLEHLVNLQLIQPEDSRKTALNDNLVTFSGKFRDRLTDEGKNRYKYLELLNANHDLNNEKDVLTRELSGMKAKVIESADWFLHLSGIPIPSEGYVVADDFFNTPNMDNSVIITSLSKKNIESLADVNSQFEHFKKDPTDANEQPFTKSLSELIRNFRSPVLGIGNETIKQMLKNVETQFADLTKTSSQQQRISTGEKILTQLQTIVNDLDQTEDHVRLSKLRSVRNYKEAVEEYHQVITKLDDNQSQLDKARQAVAHVIWFFNNQELSTRALEKQDPEPFNHWFINAKEEWDNFNTNHGGIFKAPDQPLNTVLEKTFKSEEPAPNYLNYLFTFLPVLLVVSSSISSSRVK